MNKTDFVFIKCLRDPIQIDVEIYMRSGIRDIQSVSHKITSSISGLDEQVKYLGASCLAIPPHVYEL